MGRSAGTRQERPRAQLHGQLCGDAAGEPLSAAPRLAPPSTISIALALPTARVSRCVPPRPGMTPRVTSGCARTARLAGGPVCPQRCRRSAAQSRPGR
jgi:hypothetical protein